jgi:hypothetical protein
MNVLHSKLLFITFFLEKYYMSLLLLSVKFNLPFLLFSMQYRWYKSTTLLGTGYTIQWLASHTFLVQCRYLIFFMNIRCPKYKLIHVTSLQFSLTWRANLKVQGIWCGISLSKNGVQRKWKWPPYTAHKRNMYMIQLSAFQKLWEWGKYNKIQKRHFQSI